MNKNEINDEMVEFIIKTHIDHYLNQTFPDPHPLADLLNKPLPGAHLVTPRGLYTHHGIYIGNDRVIHYSGLADGLNSGPVEEVSLSEFCNGKGFKERAHNNSVYSAQEIVARAKSRLSEKDYNLVFNNCEHFVNWCIYNVQKSEQVDAVMSTGAKVVPGAKHVHEAFQVTRSIKAYNEGKISKDKLRGDIAETAFSATSATYYGALGQAAIPVPVVGFMVGIAIGLVVANSIKNTGILSFGAHSAAIAAKKRREEIERMSQRLIPILQECQNRLQQHFERELEVKQKILDSLYSELNISIKNVDIQGSVNAFNDIAGQFGGNLSFSDEEDFKNKYF